MGNFAVVRDYFFSVSEFVVVRNVFCLVESNFILLYIVSMSVLCLLILLL